MVAPDRRAARRRRFRHGRRLRRAHPHRPERPRRAGADPHRAARGIGAAARPSRGLPGCTSPDGYTAANEDGRRADNPETLVAYCRVDPREPDGGAVAEARRCLDSGARGIKLHPRAERFGLDEPAVEGLVQLAHERRAPVLIHAGRGIPALGRNALRLAGEYPDARLILAHAAVSDLAWLWCEMPSHPNLLIDTSWWSPGDLIELFTLVPAGQIVWASDSPYGRPLTSAVMHLRYALQAGLGVDELRSIAGGQMERLLAGEELRSFDSAPGEADHLHPHLERIVSHLTAAMGAALYGGEKSELLSLALLACDVEADDENADLIRRIEAQLQLATELATEEDPGDPLPAVAAAQHRDADDRADPGGTSELRCLQAGGAGRGRFPGDRSDCAERLPRGAIRGGNRRSASSGGGGALGAPGA